MTQEAWRPVIGYEEYYQVSNLGAVRSLKRMFPLVGSKDRDGYHRVTLFTPRGQATKKVARIVCEAFNGPANALHREVAHLDNDRWNNCADNLKWVSHAENISHKYDHGTAQVGSRHPRAVLTEDQVRKIRTRYASWAKMAADHGVSVAAVQDIFRGKNWRHVA